MHRTSGSDGRDVCQENRWTLSGKPTVFNPVNPEPFTRSDITGVARPVRSDATAYTTTDIADEGLVSAHSGHDAWGGVCRWDVGALMDGVENCWAVVDDVVSRGKAFVAGLEGLVRVTCPRIECTSVRFYMKRVSD